MARATLKPTVRGERIHSTGTHLKLDVRPMAEPLYRSVDSTVDAENEQAYFERMMRANRAVGL